MGTLGHKYHYPPKKQHGHGKITIFSYIGDIHLQMVVFSQPVMLAFGRVSHMIFSGKNAQHHPRWQPLPHQTWVVPTSHSCPGMSLWSVFRWIRWEFCFILESQLRQKSPKFVRFQKGRFFTVFLSMAFLCVFCIFSHNYIVGGSGWLRLFWADLQPWWSSFL